MTVQAKRWLAAAAAAALLAGCSGGDKPIAEAKKAIRQTVAEQASAPVEPDSDDYLERYQSPEQRLEKRQQRIREAVLSAAAGTTVPAAAQ